IGQSVNPPTASAGQAGGGWRLPGPVRAVTFIPSGTGPAGARILITESISIEQPIHLSFRFSQTVKLAPPASLSSQGEETAPGPPTILLPRRAESDTRLFGRALYNLAGACGSVGA